MVERVKYHISVYSGPLHNTIGKIHKPVGKNFSHDPQDFEGKTIFPEDLAYVSMLESGFNPRALSHAGARECGNSCPKRGGDTAYGCRTPLMNGLIGKGKPGRAARYFKGTIGYRRQAVPDACPWGL